MKILALLLFVVAHANALKFQICNSGEFLDQDLIEWTPNSSNVFMSDFKYNFKYTHVKSMLYADQMRIQVPLNSNSAQNKIDRKFFICGPENAKKAACVRNITQRRQLSGQVQTNIPYDPVNYSAQISIISSMNGQIIFDLCVQDIPANVTTISRSNSSSSTGISNAIPVSSYSSTGMTSTISSTAGMGSSSTSSSAVGISSSSSAMITSSNLGNNQSSTSASATGEAETNTASDGSGPNSIPN